MGECAPDDLHLAPLLSHRKELVTVRVALLGERLDDGDEGRWKAFTVAAEVDAPVREDLAQAMLPQTACVRFGGELIGGVGVR